MWGFVIKWLFKCVVGEFDKVGMREWVLSKYII